MKLRPRIAAAAALAMVPTTLALFWYDAAMQQRGAQQMLAMFTYNHIAATRRTCESAPEKWGDEMRPGEGMWGPDRPPPDRPPPDRPPPGPRPRGERPPPPEMPMPEGPRMEGFRPSHEPAVLFAYGEDLRSRNPAAPELSAELLRNIAHRDVASASPRWPTSAVEILVRTPWGTGPCAFVLARGTTDPAWGGVLPKRPFWLLPAAVAFAAMVLAAGSVARRIRRLTESVRRSAESAYAGTIAVGGDDEVAELGRAFEAAGAEIRAQLRDRDQREQALRDFVANTTHDVMVPLTVLQGHLSTLRERAASEKGAEGLSATGAEGASATGADGASSKGAEGTAADVDALVSAMNEAHYMASLVHNLAAAARLASPEVKLQPSDVDLGALVQRVAARHRPIARQLQVSLESAIPDGALVVRADMTLLEQAVSNVVYNAVRHNRPGGHVAVILEPDGQAIFSLRVMDDGPGIAPEELSRIVTRGYRGDAARTRAPDGQGLGLHIAFRAIELHGYSMKLGASEHGGLEVVFTGRADPQAGS